MDFPQHHKGTAITQMPSTYNSTKFDPKCQLLLTPLGKYYRPMPIFTALLDFYSIIW